MEAKNLRWVFYAHLNNITSYLADENNKPLGFPFLRNLSKEDLQLLESLGICCSTDPGSFCYFDPFPKEYRERVTITAPAYFEMCKNGHIEFQKAGTYTDESINLKDIQFVNETILANIPQNKIHIPGHYVPVSE